MEIALARLMIVFKKNQQIVINYDL